MIKKIFAVLTVCLILSALVIPVFAAEEMPVSHFWCEAYDNEYVTIIKYAGSSETEVIIPSEKDGLPIKIIDDEAFSYNSRNITSVTIPDTVTHIGDKAFYNCKNLVSITIPDSVTHIGNGAFDSCNSLSSIEIPDSAAYLGDNVFHKCKSLEYVKLPNGIENIYDCTFRSCSSLKSIEIPDSVKYIGSYAFADCTSLKSIKISDGVEKINDTAFRGCCSLETIEIPENVKSVGVCAFVKCDSLQTIIVPDGLDISKTEIPETAAQIKYRKTENGVEITEIICGSGGNDAEIPKEICGIPVIPFGEDISSRAGIYEESEEI